MGDTRSPAIRLDLTQFKLHIDLPDTLELTLLFDSPSRRFYLALIGLVVQEMQRLGRLTSIPLREQVKLLALLNETVGASAGSSEEAPLLRRIYRKWKGALTDLDSAPLFKVVGKKKEVGDGIARTYQFSEAEKDRWANLFEYTGSEEHVRLRFSVDKLGARLEDAAIIYEDARNGSAWDRFVSSLKKGPEVQQRTGPDAPTIAVLPFANLNADPKEVYLGDGLAEELINGLAKLQNVLVVARSSSFMYKGRPVDVRQVGRELGVRYVLEGSIQREGDQVRIAAQLIDATTGLHVFSERYHRRLQDIFALQDEITFRILTALGAAIGRRKDARLGP